MHRISSEAPLPTRLPGTPGINVQERRKLLSGERRNELGGLTFRLDGEGDGIRYVKWVAAGTPQLDLAGEAERLSWARRWTTVPRVVELGTDADGTWRLDLAEVRARIGEPPAIDRLVVCHRDACAPNTLLHDDGLLAAHVDLGSLGVADRWADLAVAAWSTEWNYGPGYDGIVYKAYGIAPDLERIAYYRLLWDMT
jgi:kanamycin kinase